MSEPLQPCDVLLLGPHPDDVEIGAAGTVLKLVAGGATVSVVDCTHGEKGSRGTPAQRAEEAAAAARLLGLRQRLNLGLPDTAVTVDEATVRLVVATLRRARPRLCFAPSRRDPHPDHEACGHLAEKAWYFAGLANFAPELGPAHRARLLVRYPLNRPQEPTFVVDISDLQEQKAAVIRCYRSQLAPPDRSHLLQGLDVLERAQVRDRHFGARTGCVAAEPFELDGPLPLRDLASLMG